MRIVRGKRIGKLFGNVVTGLICILLLITLFVVVFMRASGGETSFFGYQLKTVLSGSMEPDMQTGSIIAIESPTNKEDLQKGDIITFQTKEDLIVTHRIDEVKNGGKQYITKGDANNAPDSEPVLAENIVGVYTGFSIPYVGYAVNFANSSTGVALLLITPGFCLLITSIIIIWRALRKLEGGKGGKQVEL